MPAFPILYEDNHLLVVNKPAGLLAQADYSGASDVLSLARDYIKAKYNKPGQVYLGLVQRLDRNVSGVMLLARTSKAAARLSAAIRENRINKRYLALVSGVPREPGGELHDWILKDEQKRQARKARAGQQGAREARLRYELIKQVTLEQDQSLASLIAVELLTGRFHQIRFQLSQHIGPILGDIKYGSTTKLDGHQLALHCHQLNLIHPVRKTELEIACPVPESWPMEARIT